jgi:hypothetical protein
MTAETLRPADILPPGTCHRRSTDDPLHGSALP